MSLCLTQKRPSHPGCIILSLILWFVCLSHAEAAKPPEVCKVCGDRASGKHYGVVSCDGCRGFFKRSIRKKQEHVYVCKDNNTCIVDVNRRNQCQACRFRKCMAMKMNPNGEFLSSV